MITYLISVYIRVVNRIKLSASSRNLTPCIVHALSSFFITLPSTTKDKKRVCWLILIRKFFISLSKAVLSGKIRGAIDAKYMPFAANTFSSLSRSAVSVIIFALSVAICCDTYTAIAEAQSIISFILRSFLSSMRLLFSRRIATIPDHKATKATANVPIMPRIVQILVSTFTLIITMILYHGKRCAQIHA